MGFPDFSNPQVKRNFLLSQMKEGKGKFYEKSKVLVFRDEAGNEYVAPEEIREYLEKQDIHKLKLPKQTAESKDPEVSK